MALKPLTLDMLPPKGGPQQPPAAAQPPDLYSLDVHAPSNPMQAHTPAPRDYADEWRGARTGVIRSFEGLPGTFGDLRDLTVMGLRAGSKKLGIPVYDNPEVDPLMNTIMGMLPNSEDTIGWAEKLHGPLYEPKTPGGQTAERRAEFAAGVLGPSKARTAKKILEDVVRKTPERLVTDVAAPMAGSEFGQYMTEGTDWETAGQVLGSVTAGSVASKAVPAVVTPKPLDVGKPQEKERLAAIRFFEKEGIPLTAGDRTGRKALQRKEAQRGGQKMQDIKYDQKFKFTSAALRRVGENAENAGPNTINKIDRRIGNKFDQIGARNNVVYDNRLQQEISTAVREYIKKSRPNEVKPLVRDTAQDILQNLASGNMPGDQYLAWRSSIGRDAVEAGNDWVTARALRGLQSALDGAMERSMQRAGNSADVALMKEARREWANFIVIKNAVARDTTGLGLISPAHLDAAVKQNKLGKSALIHGRSDFGNLTSAGRILMTPLPDSGTAANMQAISTGRIASHAGVGAVSGIATNLFSGDPALSLATTVAVPFLSYGADAAIRGAKNKTLMSRLYQGWQGNQLIPERGSAVAGGAKQVLLSGPRVTYEGSQANPIDMSGQTDQAAVRQMLDERVKNSGGRTIWFKNPDGRVLPYR